MKKACALFVIGSILLIPLIAESRMGGAGPGSVPRVAYVKPQDQSVVDISDGKGVVFEWAMLPIPSGNRDSYRIVVHKGDGYDVVVDQVIDPRTFSIAVPADKFENGVTYWWYVKQRDGKTLMWSQHDIWYFEVAKRVGDSQEPE
ncbi:MAG: hypothetical protein Q8R38_08695 [Candidatus Omnitrophota bacterium]|nr:hypothetical protein [Candidatus Omnitrophota bacterium]